MAGLTPYQTVGPFFDFALTIPGCETIATETIAGRHIAIEGSVFDGAGQPVADALIEIWQANASGQYAHPADPGGAQNDPVFRGFGRCGTDEQGRFGFTTVMPGSVAGPAGLQAPHLLVGVFARGVMTRLVTRIYFEDQPSNQDDPVLELVPADRRATLVARLIGADRYRFDVVLQGKGETVFFDV